jgi:hypothetical protein
VSRHALQVISLGDKVGVMSGLFDKGGDIGGNDMYTWADEAQWDDAVYTTCQCLNRAKPTGACRVVDVKSELNHSAIHHVMYS